MSNELKLNDTSNLEYRSTADAKLFEFLSLQNINEVALVVDLEMCESCKGVLKQFKNLYPNVTVKIVQKKQKR